jgi:oligoendopeptidase F
MTSRGRVVARERFLTLLRAGGSGYPYELYRRPVSTWPPEPLRVLAARMNRLLDEIEELESQGER